MYVLHLDLGATLRGGQRQVLYLARRLPLNGVATAIACPAYAPLGSAAREHGLEVLDLPGRREWSPRSLFFLLRHLRARCPAIIHTHDARAALLGAVLKVLAPGSFKLVHTRRVSYALGRGLSRWKYRMADLNVAVSREIAARLAASGLPREQIAVVPSGIDISLYTVQAARESAPLCIGAIGALTPQKGYPVLLDALALLAQRGLPCDWQALIVGEGPLRAGLEAQARRLGLESRVRFLGYVDSREVLPRLDILALPSVHGEGSSGVVREAWASGVALVVSDLESNLEMVDNRTNGLLFRSGVASALAAALETLVRDRGLAAALATNGRACVEAYSDAAMAASYLDLYRKLVGS